MSGEMAELLSHKVRVGTIGPEPVARRIEASATERAALARAFDLPAIAALSGDFRLWAAPAHRGEFEAELKLHARVTRICVVSLDRFETVVAETARLRFVPAASVREDAAVMEFSGEGEEPDEIPYGNDLIDLGAALAEQLALALTPYPRKPGATLPEAAAAPAVNPFTALPRRNRPQ